MRLVGRIKAQVFCEAAAAENGIHLQLCGSSHKGAASMYEGIQLTLLSLASDRLARSKPGAATRAGPIRLGVIVMSVEHVQQGCKRRVGCEWLGAWHCCWP